MPTTSTTTTTTPPIVFLENARGEVRYHTTACRRSITCEEYDESDLTYRIVHRAMRATCCNPSDKAYTSILASLAPSTEDVLCSLWADIDLPLMALAKIENAANGDTRRSDCASRKLNELLAVAVKLNNELIALKEGLDKLRGL